jgi:hypothetical protein
MGLTILCRVNLVTKNLTKKQMLAAARNAATAARVAANAAAQVSAQQNAVTATTLRNRNRRRRRNNLMSDPFGNNPYVPEQVGTQLGGPTAIPRSVRRMRNMTYANALKRGRLSPAGVSFLKCAFAPPDMQFDASVGVPDSTMIRRLLKRHRLVKPITFAANVDTYILVLPIPGYAYFTATTAAGTPLTSAVQFTGVAYSDSAQLFPSVTTGPSSTAIIDRFRHISNCCELVTTANEMTWSGNVQVFKAPIDITLRSSPAGGVDYAAYTVTGLAGLNATNEDNYTNKYTKGAFSQAYKSADIFNWKVVQTIPFASVPATVNANVDYGQLLTDGVTPFSGSSDLESIVIKVTGVTANETAILKTWACVEYAPTVGSVVYEYAMAGPDRDQLALDLYDKIVRELPIAVCVEDNAGMWERVLSIIHGVSGALTMLPGAYGSISRGVNLVSGGLQRLTL